MSEFKLMRPTQTTKLRGDFVLLRADSLRLLLPQRDVISTEYRDRVPATTAASGLFVLTDAQGMQRPVAALSSDMTLMERFPEDRFLLTRISGADQQPALAWNEVQVLMDTELEFHAMPAATQNRDGPIEAYVEIGRELAFCTTAQRMLPAALTLQD